MNLKNISTNSTISGTEITEAPCFIGDSTLTRTCRIFAYGLVMIISLVANSFVIAIVQKERAMKKSINFFIVNMCCSDLLITAVYMPRVVVILAVGYQWLLEDVLGLVTCKVFPFLMETAATVSILTILVISVDRLSAVYFPLKEFITKRIAKIIIASLWLVSLLVRFPVLFIKLRKHNNKIYCSLNLDEAFQQGAAKIYYRFVMFGIYVTPLSLIVFCYTFLVVTLMKKTQPGLVQDREVRRRKTQNRKILKMVVAVISIFIICQILYPAVFVLDAYKVNLSCNLRFVRLILAHLNCAITPCLYFVFSKNYRCGLRKISKSFMSEPKKKELIVLS